MSDINYGNILEALNDKADRDLQNVTPPPPTDYIVESYTDGNGSGYIKYKSGSIEQWGVAAVGNNTYTWLIPFPTNTYVITSAVYLQDTYENITTSSATGGFGNDICFNISIKGQDTTTVRWDRYGRNYIPPNIIIKAKYVV